MEWQGQDSIMRKMQRREEEGEEEEQEEERTMREGEGLKGRGERAE